LLSLFAITSTSSPFPFVNLMALSRRLETT
jgi:hypothetical protein